MFCWETDDDGSSVKVKTLKGKQKASQKEVRDARVNRSTAGGMRSDKSISHYGTKPEKEPETVTKFCDGW